MATTTNDDRTDDKTEKTPDGVADDLRELADQLRVKLHLAKMEARDAWQKVEPEIRSSLLKIRQAVETFVENTREKTRPKT